MRSGIEHSYCLYAHSQSTTCKFWSQLQRHKKQFEHAVQKALTFTSVYIHLYNVGIQLKLWLALVQALERESWWKGRHFQLDPHRIHPQGLQHRCCNSSMHYLNKAKTGILACILGDTHVAHRRFSCCRRESLSPLKTETHAAVTVHTVHGFVRWSHSYW